MLKILAPCDGVAGGMMAFSAEGQRVEYHAIEIDKFCRDLADDNFVIKRWANDLTLITEQDIIDNGPYDWVMFGSPCQSVSTAGKRKGLKGESGLLVDCVKILKWAKKQNPNLLYIIENVKMQKNFLLDFNKVIGHEPELINSNKFVPQNRSRYYWLNFDVLPIEDKETHVQSTLGIEVYGWSKSGRYKDKNGKVSSTPGKGKTYYSEQRFNEGYHTNTLNTGEGCRNQSTCNYVFKFMKNCPPLDPDSLWTSVLLANDGFKDLCEKTFNCKAEEIYFRLLEPFECAFLQGFPKTFKLNKSGKNSRSALWRAIGNGWSIPVIQHLIKSGHKNLAR